MHLLMALAAAVALLVWLPGAAWKASWGQWLGPLEKGPAALVFSVLWLIATSLALLCYMLLAGSTPSGTILAVIQLVLALAALAPGVSRTYRERRYVPFMKKILGLLSTRVGDEHEG